MTDLDEKPPCLLSDFDAEAVRPQVGLAAATSIAAISYALWQPASRHDGQQDDLLILTSEQLKAQQMAIQSVQGAVIPVSTHLIAPGMRWKINKTAPGPVSKTDCLADRSHRKLYFSAVLVPRSRVAGLLVNSKMPRVE